jgi:hypothetical protein
VGGLRRADGGRTKGWARWSQGMRTGGRVARSTANSRQHAARCAPGALRARTIAAELLLNLDKVGTTDDSYGNVLWTAASAETGEY